MSKKGSCSSSIEIGGMVISSIEFSGKMALVIFTAKCMLRCPYCHNSEIIEGGDVYQLEEIFQKIEESIDFIDSVVISGGEPLMQDTQVFEILKHAKSLELSTKMDTNGYYPEKLQKMIKLIDYVALDIKAPFNKYEQIIGEAIGSQVRSSMEICSEDPDTFLECRTTYVPALMEPEDVVEIAKSIQCDIYTLQQFNSKTVLDERLKEAVMPLRDDVKKIAESLKPYLDNIRIKTYEFGEEIISSSDN
ncbi:anaerobic ribonucleoside-triphosphate reductase activating protein [Methanobacterium lacus]|uniref:Anaerobic ribonucleoside-triphosphate reductase activating protein n=1 Tax=Methanobacterium lacus (strain AL-21) TaxID=877455 RepID=F0T603_METLA|nr:anaerobic ribonucleoside-triphosphate reductase activating protein [Methanobacterium lacus]ADZ10510.1 anaerobic ribonucleoside-triphosphate reductase activating protein [Methanobacterium lacus]